MAGSLVRWPLDRRRRAWIDVGKWTLRTAVLTACIASGATSDASVAASSARQAAIQFSSLSTAVNRSSGTNQTAIDPTHLHPRVMTYRNAYGTHFACDSTCYFTMFAYMGSVALILTLLAIIPVHSPSKSEHAPFLLWAGDNTPSKGHGNPLEPQEHGLFDHLAARFSERKRYVQQPDETTEVDRDQESSQEEIRVVTEVPVDEGPVKTFESIGVETDDSLLPAMPGYVVVDDVDKLFDFPRQPASPRKPGIFSTATPADEDVGRGTVVAVPTEQDVPSTKEPVSPRKSVAIRGRRASTTGGSPSESVMAAVERRSSMQKRADKRVENSKSDITHDKLGEHELDMYEYLEFIRELLEGVSIKKVCQKSAKVVKRTFYLTPDLSVVYWNSVSTKAWTSKKSSFETAMIDRVIAGVHGSANLQSKGKQEKHQLYLSVMLKGGKQLDLEAKDEKTRHRLVLGFSRLGPDKRDELEKRRQEKEEAERVAAERAAQQEQAQRPKPGGTTPLQSEEARRSADERRAKSEEDDPAEWRKQQQQERTLGRNQEDEETKGGDA